MVNFSETKTIIDLSVSLLLVACIIVFVFKFKFSIVSKSIIATLLGVIVISWIFDLSLLRTFALVITTATLFTLCLANTGTIRSTFNKLQKKGVIRKTAPDKIIDRNAVYEEIYKCVSDCSQKKVGALITFERHDDLKGLMKNGTIVKAPVSAEILETIFYPGTRLHDGAVIVKENMIYAASVYYTPTTKALSGKYGSRHRAAIGISEVSDSVTVVVSEETGRISIAQEGELSPVSIDDFIDTLDEAMKRGE